MYPSSLAPTTVVVDLDPESSRRFPWVVSGAICGRRVSETVGTNLQPRKKPKIYSLFFLFKWDRDHNGGAFNDLALHI